MSSRGLLRASSGADSYRFAIGWRGTNGFYGSRAPWLPNLTKISFAAARTRSGTRDVDGPPEATTGGQSLTHLIPASATPRRAGRASAGRARGRVRERARAARCRGRARRRGRGSTRPPARAASKGSAGEGSRCLGLGAMFRWGGPSRRRVVALGRDEPPQHVAKASRKPRSHSFTRTEQVVYGG